MPGRRIAGYVLQERIGAGAGTRTFRAHEEDTGRVAALRVVAPAMAGDPKFRDMFLAKAQAIAALDDPRIAPVYAAGLEGSVLYVATRFVFGNNLATMLRPINSSLPPARAASLVSQVAAALDAAHSIGLVHHCVKPANILMGAYPGQPEHAYVSDFGLAKLAFDYWTAQAAAEGRPAAAATLGDPDYLAPESARGDRVDGRADQYALSCVAFRMLTGTVPFSRPSSPATVLAHLYGTVPRLSTLVPELPPAVGAALSKAMAKDPAERYGSCGEFATALSDALPA